METLDRVSIMVEMCGRLPGDGTLYTIRDANEWMILLAMSSFLPCLDTTKTHVRKSKSEPLNAVSNKGYMCSGCAKPVKSMMRSRCCLGNMDVCPLGDIDVCSICRIVCESAMMTGDMSLIGWKLFLCQVEAHNYGLLLLEDDPASAPTCGALRTN